MSAKEILDACRDVIQVSAISADGSFTTTETGPCRKCADRAVEAAVRAERGAAAAHLAELIEHGKSAWASLDAEKVWPAGHAYKVKFMRGWVAGLTNAAESLRNRGGK